jgi:hypothetical protein
MSSCLFQLDLLPLLYYLPNLIQCDVDVNDRGRDISTRVSLLTPLPQLKRFKYRGLMPPAYLRRLIVAINQHLQELIIATQDYQWPFHILDGFSMDFFDILSDLRQFHFYIRLITTDATNNAGILIDETNYLIEQHYCNNVAFVPSKDISHLHSKNSKSLKQISSTRFNIQRV